MSKYNDKFNDILNIYKDTGFWYKNKNVKIGFSYANVYIDYDDGAINVDAEDEEVFSMSDFTYGCWDDFFDDFKDLKFVFTVDCAIEDNFITWNEFKKVVDGKLNKGIFSL